MRLRWKVKTSDTMNSGTDADVFLGLAGLDAVMREVEISDPGAVNDWERGDINTGIIETEDLGEDVYKRQIVRLRQKRSPLLRHS